MTRARIEDPGAGMLPLDRPSPPKDREAADAWLYEMWPGAFGALYLPIDPRSIATIRIVTRGLPGWARGLIPVRAQSRNTHFKTLTEIAAPGSRWHSLRGAATRPVSEDERAVAAAEVERLRERRR
jgi:hypothetical protein